MVLRVCQLVGGLAGIVSTREIEEGGLAGGGHDTKRGQRDTVGFVLVDCGINQHNTKKNKI